MVIKKILISMIFSINLLAFNYIDNYIPTNNNELINYLKKHGIDNNQEIITNSNLKLVIKKIFIKNNNYIYLIETKNNSNHIINITNEVGKGYAIPENLKPNEKGWLILGNVNIIPNSLIRNNLIEIFNNGNWKNLKFNKNTNIYILKGYNYFYKYNLYQWNNFIKNKENIKILSEVETKISDNQTGLFINGFIKIKDENYYQPISLYFIINKNNNKIDNLYLMPYLKSFKNFMIILNRGI